MPLTKEDIEYLTKEWAPVLNESFAEVKGYIDRSLDGIAKRIYALEDQSKQFKYLGTWDQQRWYDSGNFVTCSGSVWHCNRKTRARPGDGPDWTLAVKRGADGKDSR